MPDISKRGRGMGGGGVHLLIKTIGVTTEGGLWSRCYQPWQTAAQCKSARLSVWLVGITRGPVFLG